jgi:hypothetical protein
MTALTPREQEVYNAGCRQERERCAKIAETLEGVGYESTYCAGIETGRRKMKATPAQIAEAIRGQT